MAFAFPVLFASVIQITNGFFFASKPYEFTRPIYPEAETLMAGRYMSQYYSPYDAVSYTLGLGAQYDGKLRVYHKAFEDSVMRHENLYWLTEVIGERYAIWASTIRSQLPVDLIDSELASENSELLYDSRRAGAITIYSQVSNEVASMEYITDSSASLLQSATNGLNTAVGYMEIVTNLASVYTYDSGYYAWITNSSAINAEAREIPTLGEVTERIVAAVHDAESISNVVASFAAQYDSPESISNLCKFIEDGWSAVSTVENASRDIVAATNLSTMANMYLDGTTNAEDRAEAILLTVGAIDDNILASGKLASSLDAVSRMNKSAQGIRWSIHEEAFGIGDYSVRTPAYFGSQKSTAALVDMANCITNFYAGFPTMFAGEVMQVFDETNVPSSHGAYYSFLGARKLDGIPVFKAPKIGHALTDDVFSGMSAVGSVDQATFFMPIEDFFYSGENADAFKTERSYTKHFAVDYDCYYAAQETTGWRPSVPPPYYYLCEWSQGNPSNRDASVYVWMRRSSGSDVEEHSTVPNPATTPDGRVRYRDGTYHCELTERRFSVWAETGYRDPFPGICLDNDGTKQMVFTNTEETVVQDTADGLYTMNANTCTFDLATRCKPANVSAMSIRYERSGGNDIWYYKTNTYALSVGRARQKDGSNVGIGRDGTFHVLSLGADVKFRYDINYAGWIDWEGSSQTMRYASGEDLRAFIPFHMKSSYTGKDGRITISTTNIASEVRGKLINYICDQVSHSDFSDEPMAFQQPPFMGGSQSGGGSYAKLYPAYRYISLTFSITNIFVIGNIRFSQGSGRKLGYLVPGYMHLDAPSHEGWCGPFPFSPSDMSASNATAFAEFIGRVQTMQGDLETKSLEEFGDSQIPDRLSEYLYQMNGDFFPLDIYNTEPSPTYSDLVEHTLQHYPRPENIIFENPDP